MSKILRYRKEDIENCRLLSCINYPIKNTLAAILRYSLPQDYLNTLHFNDTHHHTSILMKSPKVNIKLGSSYEYFLYHLILYTVPLKILRNLQLLMFFWYIFVQMFEKPMHSSFSFLSRIT